MSPYDQVPAQHRSSAVPSGDDREHTQPRFASKAARPASEGEPTEPNELTEPSELPRPGEPVAAMELSGSDGPDTENQPFRGPRYERMPTSDTTKQVRTGDTMTRSLSDVGAQSTRASGELLYGDSIGPYRILEKIGGGGCGMVYAAEHEQTGELVAIKVLHAGLAQYPGQIQRFVREAQTLARMQHPAIVAFHQNGFLPDGRPYLVMELVRGRNLGALILERGSFPPADVLEIIEPVCDALTAAHRAGIVHRDIKASNIMLVDRGGKRQVKLFDFGIVKLISDDGHNNSLQTSMGHAVGTPHSMAPEQILGQPVDERTDVYALGVLIYRLLTGQYPFEMGDPHEVALMHIDSPPPRPSQAAAVSPALDRIVLRAMEKRPEGRYPTVEALLASLREAVATPAASTRRARPALAIYVEARVDTGQPLGDATVDDLAAILDMAAATLHARGLDVPLQTSTAVLGVTLLEPDAGAGPALPQSAACLAHALHRELQHRPSPSPAIHVNVCCHVDEALVDSAQATVPASIVGGAVLDVGAWAPQSEIAGVCATAAAMGLGGPAAPAYVPLALA